VTDGARSYEASQSAASRQIIALEAELGIPLFDRIGRRLHLNSEGEDLLGRSRRLLADAETLGERAVALKGGKIGTLRVSAPPQVIEYILAPFLEKYLRHHSGVEVQLVEGGASGAHNQLDRGDVHLAHIASDIGRFRSRLLYPIYVMAVLPKAHRFEPSTATGRRVAGRRAIAFAAQGLWRTSMV
jgi:DNA-binding transcriptional LysR family regulator